MYKLEEVRESKHIQEINLDTTDYLIVSKEFAENILKYIEEERYFDWIPQRTLQEMKLKPLTYLGMKVFIDEDLEGDTYKIR